MTYAVDLNIDVPVLAQHLTIDDVPKHAHTRLYTDLHINPKLLELLAEISIGVSFAESFYMPRYAKSTIHCDTKMFTDIAKMNFVYDGMRSKMHWYEAHDIAHRDTNHSIIGSNYRKYDASEVTLIHSQSIGCPALVQAGIPHNVTTLRESRLCISLFLVDLATNQYLSFSESINRCRQFIQTPS
jgi:hypothetical protein